MSHPVPSTAVSGGQEVICVSFTNALELFKSVRKRQEGQTMTEYAIVLSLVAVVVIAAVTAAVLDSASELKASDVAVDVDSSWDPGSDVTVTATYPYDISLLGVVIKSGRLSAKTTDRVE